VPENGILLSPACHRLAHTTHNKNLPFFRVRDAIAAVNRAMDAAGEPQELRIHQIGDLEQ
jgi:hypothetical protein